MFWVTSEVSVVPGALSICMHHYRVKPHSRHVSTSRQTCQSNHAPPFRESDSLRPPQA